MKFIEKKSVNWFRIFFLILQGNSKILGGGHKFKQGMLIFAIISTFLPPLMFASLAKNYSGAVPPIAPIIKGFGTFSTRVEQIGLKKISFVEFMTDDGRVYRTEHGIAPRELEDLGRLVPPPKVFAEGFLLRNGEGSYWPLIVTAQDGHVLISRDRLSGIYARATHPGIKILYFSIVPIFFWLLSIFNAIQLRKKLKLGNQ